MVLHSTMISLNMAIPNILIASESLYLKRLRRYDLFKCRKKGRGNFAPDSQLLTVPKLFLGVKLP